MTAPSSGGSDSNPDPPLKPPTQKPHPFLQQFCVLDLKIGPHIPVTASLIALHPPTAMRGGSYELPLPPLGSPVSAFDPSCLSGIYQPVAGQSIRQILALKSEPFPASISSSSPLIIRHPSGKAFFATFGMYPRLGDGSVRKVHVRQA